ncbi:MAG: hypothetical protein ABIO39_13345 [Caulobacteraceae bacterium]
MLATFGAFFFGVIHGFIPSRGMRALHPLMIAAAAFVVLQIMLHVIAATVAPKDASIPLDERERSIRLRSSRNAYVALVVGAFCVPLSLHVGALGPELGLVALAALLVAELTRAISQIVFFRLGA